MAKELKRDDKFGTATLWDLPAKPRLLIGSSELSEGETWTFSRDRIGPWNRSSHWILPDFPLAEAVACSSCFPPIFDPRRLSIDDWPESVKVLDAEGFRGPFYLSDGGVFDNLGIDVVWQSSSTVIVSDAGGQLGYLSEAGPIERVMRYSGLQGNQIKMNQLGPLLQMFRNGTPPGHYIPIYSSVAGENFKEQYPSVTFPPEFSPYEFETVKRISSIRTDLDGFTDGEIGVLENHGYVSASLIGSQAEAAKAFPAMILPNEAWADNARAFRALEKSHETKKAGAHRGWAHWIQAIGDAITPQI